MRDMPRAPAPTPQQPRLVLSAMRRAADEDSDHADVPPPELVRPVGESRGVGALRAPSPVQRVDGAAEPAPSDARVVPLLDDLRRRLRPACRDWGEAEFEAVIQRIARTQMRWTDAGYHTWRSRT
jgi:hypothetical protein